MKPEDRSIVLGIYPCARGLGWAAFGDPFTVHQHGVYRAPKNGKSAGCLSKVDWMLKRLKPEIVVLEAFDKHSSNRSRRIERLGRDIAALAAERGLEFHIYRRQDVQDAFRAVDAGTREEIAEAITRHVSALAPYLPNKRKAWEGQDRRLTRFCAAALVLTHYHFEATRLFEDLRRAA